MEQKEHKLFQKKPQKPKRPKETRPKPPKKRPGMFYWIIDTLATLAGIALIGVVVMELVMLLTD